jgi:serine O-acetyltransferase
MLATMWADLESFAELKGSRLRTPGRVIDVVMYPGVMAVLLYRLSHVCHYAGLRPFSRLLYILNYILFGVDLAPAARIGPGLALPHPTGVAVANGSVLGRKVRLMKGVTLGGAATEDPHIDGFPSIGDEAYILDGAKLFGPIHIGSHAVIGSGCMVTRSVPDGAVMVASAGRIIRYREGFGPPRREMSPESANVSESTG